MSKSSLVLFEEASEYVFDVFWKDILKSCAKNRFPRGVRYNPNNHTFSIKVNKRGKSSAIEVIELRNTPCELAQDVLSIFKDKLDLYSSIDLKIKKDEFNTFSETSDSSTSDTKKWKSIKRHAKDLLITNYVISLMKKYDITEAEATELGVSISFAIQLKTIGPDHIHFENNNISHIDGVEYNEETGKVTLINSAKTRPTTNSKQKRIETQPKKSAILQNIAKYAKINNLRIKAITEF